MNSLIQELPEEKLSQFEKIISDIILIIVEQTEQTIARSELLLAALKAQGINGKTLKKQLACLDGTPEKSDSYIIGIDVEDKIMGIKIHPDIFTYCKRIYNRQDILDALRTDNDIPNIIRTLNIKNYRIVFYVWEDGYTLSAYIKT